MAKKEQLLRLVHIVKALEKAPEGGLSYQELYDYLKQKHEDKDCEKFSFSEKTFQRDRHLLEDIFMIYIAPNGKYNPQNEMYQKLKRKVHFLSGTKVIKKHGYAV